MDKYKLRECAKKSSCESCINNRNCNYKAIVDQEIKDNFIHIDLKQWREQRVKEGGRYKHRQNDRYVIKKVIY